MTLEEFKNLKIGDEIVFKNITFKINKHSVYQDITTLDATSFKGEYVYIAHDRLNTFVTGVVVINSSKSIFNEFLTQFNISKNDKSEKEQIEEQIKTLQDKLKEIEQNDVVAIAKTLVDGDFIEIVWHDGRSVIHKVFGITEKQIGHYFDFFCDTKSNWYIPFREISKLFIRKDIKEAYEKFSATLNLKSTH